MYIYTHIYSIRDLLGDDTSGARRTGVVFGPMGSPVLHDKVARAKLQGEENVCTQLAVSSSGKDVYRGGTPLSAGGFLERGKSHSKKRYDFCCVAPF